MGQQNAAGFTRSENDRLSDLIEFLEKGVSPFHAVEETARRLQAAGFVLLDEGEDWNLVPGGRYLLTRNGSSLMAFTLPLKTLKSWRMAAAHSDSPTFRVKSLTGRKLAGFERLPVEGYGGLNLPSWLDRPLGLAGRVLVRDGQGLSPRLYRSETPLCVIPSLAVHFDPEHGKGRALAPQNELQPAWACENGADRVAEALGVAAEDIAGLDLTLYPCQPAMRMGAEGELLSSPRIDDLECAWACLRGFLARGESQTTGAVYCLFDNEEVGSSTRQGAHSNFLAQVLNRVEEALNLTRQQSAAALANSVLLSADNGHAQHPAHTDKADPENPVQLGSGVLLKYSANQRYTTSGLTGALLAELLRQAGLPFQRFTNRADLPGGSTLGNLLGQSVSIPMVDVGAPQWAMHSCVETASCRDALTLESTAGVFYSAVIERQGDGAYRLALQES